MTVYTLIPRFIEAIWTGLATWFIDACFVISDHEPAILACETGVEATRLTRFTVIIAFITEVTR